MIKFENFVILGSNHYSNNKNNFYYSIELIEDDTISLKFLDHDQFNNNNIITTLTHGFTLS